MKSLDAARRMKFVTPASDCADIRESFGVVFDMPTGFFQNRLLRVSLAAEELGLDRDAYDHRLGAAFMEGCPRAPDHEASQRYVIHVPDEATWRELYARIAQQVRIEREATACVRVRGRDMLRIAFRRVYARSTAGYRRMLRGHLSTD